MSKPNFVASLILSSAWLTFLISPDNPTSPKNTVEKEIGTSFTDEIIAAATARSAAGSNILMPPAMFKKISMLDKCILHLDSKTALNIDNLAVSQPTIVLRGEAREEGITKA